jgi:putative spermidine/putrescine transport system permease protein
MKAGMGRISRWTLLRGAGATVGLAVGSGVIQGFPTIWAQNIKDLVVNHIGPPVTAIGFGFQMLGWQTSMFNRAYEEAANDLGATPWQRLRHVTLPILLPGIIGLAMGAFTLSYDEYPRTTLAIGRSNTLPLEIYALISSASSPVLFAIGTMTTSVSFLIIGVTLVVVWRMQRRRAHIQPG